MEETSDNRDVSSSTVERSIFDHMTLSDATKFTPFSITSFPGLLTGQDIPSDQVKLGKSLTDDDQGSETYSEAGSLADYENAYANILQNELLQDLDSAELIGVEPLLPQLIEEFAIRIGHQGESQDHQNMMYIAYKYRRKIAREACRLQVELEESESKSDDSIETAESFERRHNDDHGYYSNPKNIEDWGVGGQSDFPEIYQSESHPLEDRFSLGHTVLRKSEAYAWLISAVQRNRKMNSNLPCRMKTHREWLLGMLERMTHQEQTKHQKISRRRKPDLFTVKYELSWDLIGFLQEQEYVDNSLHSIIGRVITLTGNEHFVQALPCKAYMEQMWPSTSVQFLQLLEHLVEIPAEPHECVLPDQTRILAELREVSVIFEVTGTKYGLAEATEQLFWVSTALRIPSDTPGASLNSAKVSETLFVNDTLHTDPLPKIRVSRAHHVGIAHCKIDFESKSLHNDSQLVAGDCWRNLFRHCAIVLGYPIPARPSQRPGLEVPFDMMAALANAERITPFCGNLLVKGFSTLLFPTWYEDECIFWHLVYNKDGSRISFADDRTPPPSEISPGLLQLSYSNIDHARHILGWAVKLKKNTGAIDAKYNISWSALRESSEGFALEKVQISAGQYITIGGTFARGRREKAVHIKEQNDYVGRLQTLGNKFVLLHDIEVRKAWLVDGLSALLHLVRANLTYIHRQDDYAAAILLRPEAFKTKGGYSGRKAAFETLRDPQNMKLRLYRKEAGSNNTGNATEDSDFHCMVDTVKYIMHILEQIIDHQADERAENSVGYRIKRSPWAQLEGFDFMDIATKFDPVWSRATTLHVDGQGWVGLTRAIHAVTLFGKGFGDLLEPIYEGGKWNQCENCHWNSSVPPKRDILAVSMTELENIVERRGSKSETSWRLVDDLHLDFSPEVFSTCSRSGRRKCRQRILKIRRNSLDDQEDKGKEWDKTKFFPNLISKMVNSRRGIRTGGKASVMMPLNISTGGVLLGMTPNRLRKDAREEKETYSTSSGKRVPQPVMLAPETRPLHHVISPGSSSFPTSQDVSTTLRSNGESTSLTEPVTTPATTPDNLANDK